MTTESQIFEIKKKALSRYCWATLDAEYLNKIPLKWKEGAIDSMLVQKQDAPTERIKDLIDFVINETLKELSKSPHQPTKEEKIENDNTKNDPSK